MIILLELIVKHKMVGDILIPWCPWKRFYWYLHMGSNHFVYYQLSMLRGMTLQFDTFPDSDWKVYQKRNEMDRLSRNPMGFNNGNRFYNIKFSPFLISIKNTVCQFNVNV